MRRVLIPCECDGLFPGWSSMVKGVVDFANLLSGITRGTLLQDEIPRVIEDILTRQT